jgi:hypothetical protein
MTKPGKIAAAQQARVKSLAHFPLASFRVTVLEVEGTVQLVYAAEEWPGVKTLANQFAGPETAGQLRAIADHLDAVFAGDGRS